MTEGFARDDSYVSSRSPLMSSRAKRGISLLEVVQMNQEYYIYLLTNKSLNVLYTGVTNHIIRRIYEHKIKAVEGFTKKYNVDRLVYYEVYPEINDAIAREKQIKGWSRKKKVALINQMNPEWQDLYEELI